MYTLKFFSSDDMNKAIKALKDYYYYLYDFKQDEDENTITISEGYFASLVSNKALPKEFNVTKLDEYQINYTIEYEDYTFNGFADSNKDALKAFYNFVRNGFGNLETLVITDIKIN